MIAASWLQILLLALVQGMAELLPVSSSAHVIVAEKLMGLDPTLPEMTFLLVMLHSGTMIAVAIYFLPRWRRRLAGGAERGPFLRAVAISTVVSLGLGFVLLEAMQHVVLPWLFGVHDKVELEKAFGSLPLVGGALLAVGALIVWAGSVPPAAQGAIGDRQAGWIGIAQAIAVPFRGFSRSGSTISAGLLRGVPRELAEDFSFALAVLITPLAIAREARPLLHGTGGVAAELAPGVIGAVLAALAGLVALKWLSAWLEHGRWKLFGFYCLAGGAALLVAYGAGWR